MMLIIILANLLVMMAGLKRRKSGTVEITMENSCWVIAFSQLYCKKKVFSSTISVGTVSENEIRKRRTQRCKIIFKIIILLYPTAIFRQPEMTSHHHTIKLLLLKKLILKLRFSRTWTIYMTHKYDSFPSINQSFSRKIISAAINMSHVMQIMYLSFQTCNGLSFINKCIPISPKNPSIFIYFNFFWDWQIALWWAGAIEIDILLPESAI